MYVDDGARHVVGRWIRRGLLGGSDGPDRGLLANYLGEARALAGRGGGNLWLVEPHLPARRLPGFAAEVARHLASAGVRTGDVKVLEGSTSARIEVLRRSPAS